MKILDILTQQFIKERPEVLDDEFPDKFDAWLQEKDIADILDYEII